MNKDIDVINELLVDLFNDILTIEQKSLQYVSFKDLSVTEIHTIEAIGIHKQRRMKDVARQLGITLGTLTTAINRLVKKQYVTRARSKEDRRIVYIQLTEKGKTAFKIHRKFHSNMVEEIVEELTAEEEMVLTKSLEKLNNFFRSKYNLKIESKEKSNE